MHLGAAIRYFAGGSPYNIVCCFCVSYSEVLSSVWIVIEAINACPQFHIAYPESLEVQQRIEAEFEATSTPGIRNCAGAINGILIWMLKPSLEEAKKAGVDQWKFLYCRKHKFGLNCQAVLDFCGRIMDILMKCGDASTNCLAFEASKLHIIAHCIILIYCTIPNLTSTIPFQEFIHVVPHTKNGRIFQFY